jgi:dTDP-3-amino-2,3,6-trideoxy-4-keto-D-glucose/dTDP-3-amino-3,4,6-trideoxy-alpha-D-glucose/dTDP-2,6-dideoxy-D-kanosamine transaminase
MQVKYPYLDDQFSDVEAYFDDLRRWVATGEYTLGPFVEAFERKFADFVGAKYAIGTNTGTGALIMALKAVGVGPGDEVITVPNTFIATIGAIVAAGARPVFVDSDQRYQIDSNQIEGAINEKTKAILPVHWAGCPCDIEAIVEIGLRRDIAVVEDACPSVGASVNGRHVGTFGKASGISMHPLKPLNVWGDGGIVITNDEEVDAYLRLYRNHGLVDRDHVSMWGVNDRLQPFQAVVGARVLDDVNEQVDKRIANARLLDDGLQELSEFIHIPERLPGVKEVYQLYQVGVQQRDDLIAHLHAKEIDCKVHYPIPVHLQEAATDLGYKRGDFPVCEEQADEILTIPAHQHITAEQIEYVVDCIRDFYLK